MNFGQNLIDLCIENNTNLKRLAKDVSIQDSLLYKYAKNTSVPTLENLIKLAKYFDCSIGFLVGQCEQSKFESVPQTNSTNFFERYEFLRKTNKYSHYYVCKTLGISISSIRNWKTGTIPYIDTLLKLANFFIDSIDYLVGLSNNI